MAQGTIRKGFFFYFGLLVLLLISIFFICLAVMMFNPGSTVLWMQYFTEDNHILVEKTTDEGKKDIDYSKLTTLEIECSYANVSVQRSKEFTSNGIHIINNAKGFTAASSAVKFSYEATLSGDSTLRIKVVEPTGFVYFSKDIKIVLHAYSENSLNFNNLKLKVLTKEGNVEIGGTNTREAEEVNLNSLNVETGKGNINIGDKLNTKSLSALTLTASEGYIQSFKSVKFGDNKTANGIEANCDATIKTEKGRILFGVLNMSGANVNLICKSGDVAIDNIYANKTSVSCVQGNYKLGDIYGDLDYTNSEDSILAPNITAGKITGSFRLSTQSNVDSAPRINIKEITKNLVVISDRGDLNVKKVHGAISVTSENQLNVNLVVADDKSASDTISIVNKNGEVKLGFIGTMAGNVGITTDTSKIVVNVTSVTKFTSNAYVNDQAGTTKLADDKISVSHGLSGVQTKNPLNVEGTSAIRGNMTIKTNASVAYNLVAVDSLVA